MPTGYTQRLLDNPNMTTTEFILLCARAMGAMIMMRDESLDAKIPEQFEPDQYYAKRLEEDRLALDRWKALSDDEKLIEIKEGMKENIKRWEELIEEKKKNNFIFEAMLSKIESWQPPSPEHVNFKKFMIEQLKTSIDSVDYYEEEIKKQQEKKIEDLVKARTEYLEHDIAYDQDEHNEEVERTELRNKWVSDLRAALPEE